MKTFILITALLLCSFNWISMSVSQNVEVQPGEEVTLQCANISTSNTATFWFRLCNGAQPKCISVMFSNDKSLAYCEEFESGYFEMSSNISTIFLKIKNVAVSDSGLYFCGFYTDGKTIILSGTYLKVQDVADGLTHEQMMTVILGNLTVFLLLVIVSLAVKIRRFHTGICTTSFKLSNQTFVNVDSDAMTYTAVSFHPKAKIRRPAPPRELEPNVVYAATR
uniref:Ig-like domain-containing protein n=1 Tax=Haplochromis burtoni TaxID=8153 RepID=A0A3Q2VZ93_HAPBU